jgi:hypothetical protein
VMGAGIPIGYIGGAGGFGPQSPGMGPHAPGAAAAAAGAAAAASYTGRPVYSPSPSFSRSPSSTSRAWGMMRGLVSSVATMALGSGVAAQQQPADWETR